MFRTSERTSIAAGLLAGLFAIALFGWLVGPRRVVSTVSDLRLLPFSLGFAVVVAGVTAQYLALVALLAVRPTLGSALAYLRGVYGRQLLPVGTVAAPVLIAYSMRGATGISIDRGLPAALVSQVVTFLGSTVVALVGSLLLVSGGRSALLPLVGVLAVVLLGWLGALGALVAGLDVERAVAGGAAFLNRTLGRVSSVVAAKTEPKTVRRRLDGFEDARRLIRNDPARIGVALAWSVVGWTLLTLPAVTTTTALGASIPLGVAFVAVPVSGLLNALPVPGGIGGVEVALAGILVALTGFDVAVAAVAAFCVRLCTYWFVLLLGGAATVALSTGIDLPTRS